jgi:neutral trehalase
VAARRSSVAAGLRFGYSSNEIGFGWTNAVFEVLFDQLPAQKKAALTSQ